MASSGIVRPQPRIIVLPYPGDRGELVYQEPFVGLFWQAVLKTDRCWLWTGSMQGEYGVYADIPAHRYAYCITYGSVPVDKHLHHICFNKLCVRPTHLQPLTPAEHGLIHHKRLDAWSGCGYIPNVRLHSVKYVISPKPERLLKAKRRQAIRPKVAVCFDAKQARQVRLIAETEYRSFTSQIRVLIDEALAARSGKPLVQYTAGWWKFWQEWQSRQQNRSVN